MTGAEAFGLCLAELLHRPDPFGLLLIDLDNFGRIQPLFTQDKHRVVSDIRDMIINLGFAEVYRLGSDDYASLVTDGDVLDAAIRIGQTLRSERWRANGELWKLTCSAGVARRPVDGNDRVTLITHAQRNLTTSKLYGKDGVFYGGYTRF